jgi:hypothetical protein
MTRRNWPVTKSKRVDLAIADLIIWVRQSNNPVDGESFPTPFKNLITRKIPGRRQSRQDLRKPAILHEHRSTRP